jgi:hypothetical protein
LEIAFSEIALIPFDKEGEANEGKNIYKKVEQEIIIHNAITERLNKYLSLFT